MPDRTVQPTSDTAGLTPRVYPLDAPVDDPRFSFGLAIDVANVLAAHGYPTLTSGLDIVALEQALFGFLYRPVSASLGNQVADYGHDRIDNAVEAAPVPAAVEGHAEFTGRASVPDIEDYAHGGSPHEWRDELQCLPGCYDPTLVADHVPGCLNGGQ